MTTIFAEGGTIAIFVIFGALVFLMIGIAVFGSTKERRKKKVDSTKRETSNINIEQFYVSSFFWLNLTLGQLETDLNNFTPSIGSKTYKQIAEDAMYTVKRIERHEMYNELKKSEKYFPSLNEVLKDLKASKPQNWMKDAYFASNLISAKTKSYLENYKNEFNLVEKEFKKELKDRGKKN